MGGWFCCFSKVRPTRVLNKGDRLIIYLSSAPTPLNLTLLDKCRCTLRDPWRVLLAQLLEQGHESLGRAGFHAGVDLDVSLATQGAVAS